MGGSVARAVALSVASLAAAIAGFELAARLGLDTEAASSVALGVLASVSMMSLAVCGLKPLSLLGALWPPRFEIYLSWTAAATLLGVSLSLGNAGEIVPVVFAALTVLFEEIVFRGIPYLLAAHWVQMPFVAVGIALTASLVFSALHVSLYPAMFVDRVVFSLLAFFLVTRFASIWPAVAYHLFANAATLALAPIWHNSASAWLFLVLDAGIFVLVAGTMLSTSRGLRTLEGTAEVKR